MPEAPGIPGLPAGSELSKTIDREAIVSLGPQALPSSIGPYRIIECIGEGGMGVVYKAEQREPVRRIVALKVIKLGMDTKEVVARFEAERQALALMSHPNVAKVFDAGITEIGRPYFAMEHVPGVSILSYCDTQKLTTKERLELFIPVCHAVQHAHQKGIIHRDLKPGNILVTMFDGKPVSKVIDFGVAKATNFNLTDKTLFTHLGSVVGTVEYMSPEQATSNGLDVDTRTDIYSLGVILYQLLTGTLPFESETLRKAGMEARAKIILDTDPPKPSSRLTGRRKSSGGHREPDSEEIARRHRSDPRTLRKELEGDLDRIVLKAIEKDRTRRYETANALALDLRRYLSDEPVLARPPSSAYKLRKFIRRHRLEITATAAVLVTLMVGIAATTYGLVQRHIASINGALVEQKQREADEATRTARRVSSLFQDALSPMTPDGLRRTPVEILDGVAKRLHGRALADEPAIEAGMRAVLARQYVDIGLYQRAIPEFEAAFALNRRLRNGAGSEPISSLNEMAAALVTNDDLAAAEPLVNEAMQRESEPGFSDQAVYAMTLDLSGSILAGGGDWASASTHYRQALEIRQKVPGDSRELADTLAHQADVLLHYGNPEGQAALDKARQMYSRVFALQPLGMIGPLRRMARSATSRGDGAAADKMLVVFFEAGLLDRQLDLRFLEEWTGAVGARLKAEPANADLWIRRGGLDGRRGEFEQAAADYARALDIQPANAEAWHCLLPLLLETGHADVYRTKRSQVLQRFRETAIASAMHQISKGSLCFPLDAEDLATAWKLADGAVRLSRRPTNQFICQSMGMAEFRAGHYRRAIDWLTQSRSHAYLYIDAMADFYIAMARARLGEKDQAQVELNAGIRLWESASRPGVNDLGQFQDWIYCVLARDEAQKVVAGHAPDGQSL